MKKKMNIAAITNELAGGSAFFPSYKKGQSSPTASDGLVEPKREAGSERGRGTPVPRTVPRPEPRTSGLVPKLHRPIRQRQPFDIYEDQYVQLKKIAEEERRFVNGRGMSQMVREAIDNYLKGQKPPQT